MPVHHDPGDPPVVLSLHVGSSWLRAAVAVTDGLGRHVVVAVPDIARGPAVPQR